MNTLTIALLSFRTITRLLVKLLLISFVTQLIACSSTRQLQAEIIDVNGKPVPSAIIYYEVIASQKTFDFGFAIANDAGKIPAIKNEPVSINWRTGAQVSIAVFAPGYVSTVLMNPPGKVSLKDNIIILRTPAQSIVPFEPRILSLAFPFAENPVLKSRLLNPRYLPLKQAFVAAYELVDVGEGIRPEHQQKKIKAVRSLKAPGS